MLLGVGSFANLPTNLVYNGSASAPTGFYFIENGPVSTGDYVLIRLPPKAKALVEERGYLPLNVPLLKYVAAVSGHRICREGGRVFIDGRHVAMALEADRTGLKLPVWGGCLVLERDKIFLLQDHPYSFDSRYFGPVSRELIIGKAVKFSLFSPRSGSS